jgi:lysophospholipase L1-like esterase
MRKKKIEELDPNFRQKAVEQDAGTLDWISATDPRLTVRGLAWFEENGKGFSRLPLRAQGVVRPEVWQLAQAPASARVVFKTNATRLALRLENHGLANMAHFAVTGSDGTFVYEGAPFLMKPWNMIAPTIGQSRAEKEIAASLPPAVREFTIYLPLYAPLKTFEIGLPRSASIERPTSPRLPKPVVFYGTSITQGGCASTAGGDFVSAVGRLLNLDVVNLGFSGNGRGEPEVARFIGEIDAAAIVLDYCANTNTDGLQQTLPEFVAILRKQHPFVPILLVSKIHFYPEEISGHNSRSEHERQRDVMIRFYAQARAAGDGNIHFTDGWSLVQAAEDLALVDGAHPTSMGFALMAQRLAPQLAYVLNL